MPVDGTWSTVAQFLTERAGGPGLAPTERAGGPGLSADWLASLGAVLDDGTPITPTTPYRPGERVHLHREPTTETPVPGDMPILYRDENVVVVDKPHFLATMPRGAHVRQTALLRLRAELDLPDLVPAHRLDRLTAGVLLLTARPGVRAAYQQLFARREVAKRYFAVARLDPERDLPRTAVSRIVKDRGNLQAVEVAGEPNAITRIELLDRLDADRGLYRLTPATGRTHQLRVHLNSLGIPIENDPLYPRIREVDPADFTAPLRLVATELAFSDPITGRRQTFRSSRRP